MKLLFDISATQPNHSGKRHGGGRYGEVVFLRMVDLGIEFSCFYDSQKWLNPDIEKVIKEKDIPTYDISKRGLQEIVSTEKFERVYSCLLTSEVLHLSDCEVYGTVHGMRGFETPWDSCFWDYKSSTKEKIKFIVGRTMPGWWRARMEKRYRDNLLGTGAKFATVSEHSKYAMLSFFPETKNREVRVFYSPNTSPDDSKRGIIERKEDCEKYFLAVSGNRWEKNNVRAIEAFDKLISNGLIKDVRMKVTGARAENIRYKPENPDAFDFLGYVSDEELDDLYAGAYLFVYPSLNEGFGYPPLEAMRYHVPVIASPLSSMAEVCDQGALYFNPFLVEEIMGRMMMMMDEKVHEEFSERGYKQFLKIRERQELDLDGLIEYFST